MQTSMIHNIESVNSIVYVVPILIHNIFGVTIFNCLSLAGYICID